LYFSNKIYFSTKKNDEHKLRITVW